MIDKVTPSSKSSKISYPQPNHPDSEDDTASSDSTLELDLSLLHIAQLISRIHAKAQCYGTDHKLFDAEIHTINVIKQHDGIHLTKIAEKLDITKGAVSQNILRLIKKGLLEKYEDPEKRSRHILKLTRKGEIAHEHHQQLHRQFRFLIDKTLQEASQDQRLFLKNFFLTLRKEFMDHDFNG